MDGRLPPQYDGRPTRRSGLRDDRFHGGCEGEESGSAVLAGLKQY
jgi:hypothetical protein